MQILFSTDIIGSFVAFVIIYFERNNMENLKFEEMNLSNDIVRAVKDMGFEEATPIQSQAISVIMDGKDIIGQSQTGTGKTAAFGLPCL